MQNLTKRLSVWASIIAAILTVPLLANWPWTGSDFVFAVVALFGSALVYELVARQGSTTTYRTAVGLAVATALLLVWINAAVGIIGDGDLDSPNALYFGMLILGLISAIVSRFQPQGMSRTLFGMAIAQMLVPIIALFIWNPQTTSWAPGVLPVFMLNAGFAVLFAGSALLFRRANNFIS